MQTSVVNNEELLQRLVADPQKYFDDVNREARRVGSIVSSRVSGRKVPRVTSSKAEGKRE